MSIGKALSATALAALLPFSAGAADGGKIDFNTQVRPILNSKCTGCHGGVKRNSNLSLLHRAEALAPAKSGLPAIVPGKPEESEMIFRVSAEDESDRMPPEGDPLTPEQVEILRKWISQGAEWQVHWAYTPVEQPEVPETLPEPANNGIDYFINGRLEQEGLRPAGRADKGTLLRRVYLDLIGLPPSPDAVDAFMADTAPDAFEKVVDELLASPRYGERWASVWLDLARYADTKGYEKDRHRDMWRYREWVIDAYNRDLPYDAFTIEQLAGDLLPEPTDNQLAATAFHRNTMTNEEGGTDDEEFRVAAVVDRVNTTMEVWQGATFSCVQCHSHPYEPFEHKDYYSLMAFFNNSADADRNDEAPVISIHTQVARKRAKQLENEIEQLKAELDTHAASPESREAFARWREGLVPSGDWKRLKPVSATTEKGATLEVQADSSLLSKGANPRNEAYIIELSPPEGQLTALRLDLFPHENMPRGGVGRSPNDGNIVLTEFSVEIAKAATQVEARYVRVELPGKDRFLHLAEVEAFSNGRNVAQEGTATQSSTDYGGDAKRAIDGNTDGIYDRSRSVNHTAQENDPWWEVDLSSGKPIQRLRIWNRTDPGVENRFDGGIVKLLDAGRNTLWEHAFKKAPLKEAMLDVSSRSIGFAHATAGFSQKNWDILGAIDDNDQTGWAVSPKQLEPHHATFIFDETVELEEGDRVVVSLRHDHKTWNLFGLGHFALSASHESAYSRQAELDAQTLAILQKPQDELSPDQEKELRRQFASFAPEFAELREELASLERELKMLPETTLPVMRELPEDRARETRVFIRGNWQEKGDLVEPGTPAVLPPMAEDLPKNRLGLAKWIASPENPLTARVAVNRMWEQLFGRGIVETLEDLGTQGELPTHPELLDHLAWRFTHVHDWSQKAMLKEIVMSAAYQRDSASTREMTERDPHNRLFARGPRFRLGAEQVRDQALAVSGLLSEKMYGPSVMPHQPEGVWQVVYSGASWETAKGGDAYRRALYTYWRRTSPYPSMVSFDAPSREFCLSRRVRTNTPLQALVTLNDSVYVEAAQHMAKRLQTESGDEPEDWMRYGYKLALARDAKEHEVDEMLDLYRDTLRYFGDRPTESAAVAETPKLAALTVVANVFLNLDEVLTKE